MKVLTIKTIAFLSYIITITYCHVLGIKNQVISFWIFLDYSQVILEVMSSAFLQQFCYLLRFIYYATSLLWTNIWDLCSIRKKCFKAFKHIIFSSDCHQQNIYLTGQRGEVLKHLNLMPEFKFSLVLVCRRQ